MPDFDSPWKHLSESFFPELIQFYLPPAFDDINWEHKITSLDKELPKLDPMSQTGGRYADKLFSVQRKDGKDSLVFIHMEFQNQKDDELPLRMFIYNYRIFDRYRRPVVSLAILGDPNHQWRPNQFHFALWQFSLSMAFPVVKLMDYEEDLPGLLAHKNPFALVTAAHILALRTKGKPKLRMRQKLDLIKRLYLNGYSPQKVVAFFRFIDWVLQLPPNLEQQLQHDLAVFEGEQNMPYMMRFERLAQERGEKIGEARGETRGEARGEARGKRESIVDTLALRFGPLPPNIAPALEKVPPERLIELLRLAVTTTSIETFSRHLNE
ncbi:Rpn family recombination-promoting nuclease/putative transposase [Acanthopleuribacter pedis]|uniref:Rpn family recombination-promoting nuclease/putative transposase n=1 Tax=Acanthopleuribacter pedis TaxID=442870 RepID=A0A8J7QDM3_9BACT|nr:Rpn family recombination-promoting nuclease/putative transposase [Acanthopleuribacter pedis]MBO1317675.1 Rpn family recombination-promoting nuclease/putative transposase [Acanthopleuribacter pedis]